MAIIWHYIDRDGRDVVTEWASSIPKRQLGKLQNQIDRLALYGSALKPLPLSDAGQPPLLKFKIHGDVELRPIIWQMIEAPRAEDEEFVLLAGAIEVSWKYVPLNVLEIAEYRRQELLKDENRKARHSRFKKSKS